MRQSIPVSEEDDSTDASRMKVITAEIDASVPFKLGKQQFSYETSLFTQWNKTPLVSQDKLTIGNRYTVRGFDGEQSLSGERGFYWQHTLAWYFHPRHQFYFGVDTGHVSSPILFWCGYGTCFWRKYPIYDKKRFDWSDNRI